MGWCSGTEIFDKIVGQIIESDLDVETKKLFIYNIVDTLEDHDWDCQEESDYADNKIVQSIFRELHPDWFEDETENLKEQLKNMRRERNELARMAYVFAKDNGIDYEYEFVQRYENGYYK